MPTQLWEIKLDISNNPESTAHATTARMESRTQPKMSTVKLLDELSKQINLALSILNSGK